MIGEHDDLVGPRGVAAGALDAAELLVELAERLERVGPLEPVVGHLVVAREGGVDRRPATHHVREDPVHDRVADDHAERAAQERVAAAVAARLDVAALRARGGRPPSRTSQKNRASAWVTFTPSAKNAR